MLEDISWIISRAFCKSVIYPSYFSIYALNYLYFADMRVSCVYSQGNNDYINLLAFTFFVSVLIISYLMHPVSGNARI